MKKQMSLIFGSIIGLILLLWFFDYYLHLISVKILNSIRDELLSFLEIVALFLLIIIIITIVRWLLQRPEGIVILPFEIVNVSNNEKLSSYDGRSIADALTADMIAILNIHKQRQTENTDKGAGQNVASDSSANSSSKPETLDNTDPNNTGIPAQKNLLKGTGKFTTSEFLSIGENLDAGFSDIANITVSGNSISIGKILLTLKKLWNQRDPKYVISGSAQKYGSIIKFVSRLKAAGEKNIIICEVQQTIQADDEIPGVIKDLSFKIWQNIPKGWNDISGTESNTWLGLKYFTESINYYNKYKLSRSKEHLDNASANCIKASEEEKGYKNLYALAYSLGFEKYQLGGYDKAQELFTCAGNIAYDAFSPLSDEFKTNATNAHNAIGSCHLYQLQYPDAEFNFRKAIDLRPNNRDGYYNLSLVLADLRRTDEAYNILEIAMEKNIIDKNNKVIIGDWLTDLGLKEQALEKYNEAILGEPTNEKLYNKCGKIYYMLGKENQDKAKRYYTKAIEAFKTVLKIKPEFSDGFGNPHNDIGIIYAELGQSKEAKEEFKHALHQNPAFADPHFNLGNIYFNAGLNDYQKAISEYEIAVQLYPGNADGFYNLGQIYKELKDYEKAILNYNNAIARNPNIGDYHIGLGYALFTVDRFDEAEIEFKKALNLNPNDIGAHAGLGYLYRLKEDYPNAILAFRHAIRLDEKNAEIHRGLGEVFRKLKNWDEAIWTYEQAISIDDKDPYAHLCLGGCYREKGNLVKYAEEKEIAESLRENWPKNEYSLACYEALIGHPEQAVSYLRASLKIPLQTIRFINLDIDLDSIRSEPEYNRLIEEYTPY